MIINTIHHKLKYRKTNPHSRSVWQILHLDPTLLLLLTILILFGFAILYSASMQHVQRIIRELTHIGLAFAVMFFLAQIPPHVYRRWSPWLYTLGIILLLVVLIMGQIHKGAQRWLSLGVFRFQPSEMMKLVIPMMLAWFYTHRQLPPKIKDLFISLIIIIIPVILTIKEPDLGTGIILAAGGLSILFLSGLRWRIIVTALIGLIISIPISWHVLHDYQKQRVLTFLNPERDPLGAGYHIIQSKIAIGSGGIFGKGWLAGTQSHLHFLPEHATDFIFAVCAEEFGFIGCVILLLIYLSIITRCIFIAGNAQDTYTRLLAGSLSIMFFISIFINIGMVSGLLPVVGIPLPLISYGGSSMITTIAYFGVLMSICSHRTLLTK